MPDPCGPWEDAAAREELLLLHARMLWAAIATVPLAARNDPFHRRELKRYCKESIWAVTELRVTEKYDLRFVSAGVFLACREHGRLRGWMRSQGRGPYPSLNHEHVITKEHLNGLLLAAGSLADVETVLRTAIGCAVTEKEHLALHGTQGEGWNRYAAARVAVWDRQAQRWREDCGAAPAVPA